MTQRQEQLAKILARFLRNFDYKRAVQDIEAQFVEQPAMDREAWQDRPPQDASGDDPWPEKAGV